MLAAVWFGEKERALATSIAINANTLGIAAAYLIAPLAVQVPVRVRGKMEAARHLDGALRGGRAVYKIFSAEPLTDAEMIAARLYTGPRTRCGAPNPR